VKNALSYLHPGQIADLRLPATGEEVLRSLTQWELEPAPSESTIPAE
jgi:hypothetical protein